MVSLTTFIVKEVSRLFSAILAKSMAGRGIVNLRRRVQTLSAGQTDASIVKGGEHVEDSKSGFKLLGTFVQKSGQPLTRVDPEVCDVAVELI